MVLVVAVVIVAAWAVWWTKWRQPEAAPSAAPEAATTTNEPSATASSNPAFDKLKGQWVRPDGGYVLEIRGVEPSGKMDATYSNPKSIHVEKAVAMQEGGVPKVFIELRDVNYPGSTYTLAYDRAGDQLAGIYYQAAMQQSFEVVFQRLK